ncbi:MAG: ATP-binding protein [Candidatus Aenigmarchaeota archaeon]|nr:ATP-binding protein [Candidatus Aenigmarchaeota archaeon]
MRIYVSSGTKGGVGKSTFAVLLSLKLSKSSKVLLFDADVECPNDYLLLSQKLKESVGFTYQEFPEIDEQKCKKCGVCAKVCREHAIFWVPGKYPIILNDLCSGCGACKIACPFNAIRMNRKVSGEIFVNQINPNLWLVTGLSKPGITETGPVVKQAKDFVLKFAEERGIDYLIVDTAPGTHCNVIQALLNAEKVYAVTEPTPLGAHDLSIMLELTKRIGIKSEIVLNKSNIGNRKLIEKVSKEYNVPISVEIPYSEELVKAYSTGKLVEFTDKLKLVVE